MRQRIFILIDFDNVFKKELSAYSEQEFQYIFKEIINTVLLYEPNPLEIHMRLYGGWFKENILSSKASTLQQLISSFSLFPIKINNVIVKGTIELATTMYFYPSHVWTNTVKEKPGAARIRINSEKLSESCTTNKEQCPAFILNKFTASKDKKCSLSGCAVKNSDAFRRVEQKMVDTIISCDLIALSNEDNISSIFLFSDDFDLLPPLGFCSIFKKQKNPSLQIHLLVRNDRQISLIEDLLKPFDIKIAGYDKI